ncbi:hypothetical protein BN439_2544 [Erwinia amylovora Ea644]|nr:hypothetical protein [Erwinia amylovora]CCP03594.1 hypothetical protein BN439_2544 [Erwinia amylovora Ea644]CCP07631.1 hypothetical protein BN440_2614 [Erwinia amylovora MR1]
MRQYEAWLDLSAIAPSQATARLAKPGIDYHPNQPDFRRLTSVEH